MGRTSSIFDDVEREERARLRKAKLIADYRAGVAKAKAQAAKPRLSALAPVGKAVGKGAVAGAKGLWTGLENIAGNYAANRAKRKKQRGDGFGADFQF